MTIFLSYRSHELDFTQFLAKELQGKGIDIWMDRRGGIEGGDDWRLSIQQAIASCSLLVVVLSPSYLTSTWCLRELARADTLGKPVLPLLLEDTSAAVLPIELSRVQYIDFRNWRDTAAFADALQMLVKRIQFYEMRALQPIQKESGEVFTGQYQKSLAGEAMTTMNNLQSLFTINLWVTKAPGSNNRDVTITPTYMTSCTIGDEITIHFNSSVNCYLTLVNIGTSGKMTVLFPNVYVQNNQIDANQTYAFPDPTAPFSYGVSGPPGTEIIKALATLTPIKLLQIDFSRMDGLPFYVSGDANISRDVQLISKQVGQIRVEDWSEASYGFEVRTL